MPFFTHRLSQSSTESRRLPFVLGSSAFHTPATQPVSSVPSAASFSKRSA